MIRVCLTATLLTLGLLAPAFQQTEGASKSSATASTARTSAPDEPRVLQPGSPKPVPVPPFSVFRESKCDSSGNLYFAVGGNTHRLGPLIEISHDGGASTAFAPPTPEKLDPGDEIGFRDFAVTPSGRVYELLQNTNEQGIVVIEFDSDGSVKHTTKPTTPDGLAVRSLTVFDDGTALLRGFIQRRSEADSAQAYVALFDASGKLRKELTDFPDFHLSVLRTALQDEGIAVGQDANAYLLDANFISVISESGEIVRRMPYQKPDPALVARGLMLSDGLIATRLMQVNGSEFTPRYLVVRADTGETTGYYALPGETPEMGVCFSRTGGFTFLTEPFLSRQNFKLALVNAPLR